MATDLSALDPFAREREEAELSCYGEYIPEASWSTQWRPLDGYTYRIDLFSDLHKDASGYRPTNRFWEALRGSSPEKLQGVWDELCDQL